MGEPSSPRSFLSAGVSPKEELARTVKDLVELSIPSLELQGDINQAAHLLSLPLARHREGERLEQLCQVLRTSTHFHTQAQKHGVFDKLSEFLLVSVTELQDILRFPGIKFCFTVTSTSRSGPSAEEWHEFLRTSLQHHEEKCFRCVHRKLLDVSVKGSSHLRESFSALTEAESDNMNFSGLIPCLPQKPKTASRKRIQRMLSVPVIPAAAVEYLAQAVNPDQYASNRSGFGSVAADTSTNVLHAFVAAQMAGLEEKDFTPEVILEVVHLLQAPSKLAEAVQSKSALILPALRPIALGLLCLVYLSAVPENHEGILSSQCAELVPVLLSHVDLRQVFPLDGQEQIRHLQLLALAVAFHLSSTPSGLARMIQYGVLNKVLDILTRLHLRSISWSACLAASEGTKQKFARSSRTKFVPAAKICEPTWNSFNPQEVTLVGLSLQMFLRALDHEAHMEYVSSILLDHPDALATLAGIITSNLLLFDDRACAMEVICRLLLLQDLEPHNDNAPGKRPGRKETNPSGMMHSTGPWSDVVRFILPDCLLCEEGVGLSFDGAPEARKAEPTSMVLYKRLVALLKQLSFISAILSLLDQPQIWFPDAEKSLRITIACAGMLIHEYDVSNEVIPNAGSLRGLLHAKILHVSNCCPPDVIDRIETMCSRLEEMELRSLPPIRSLANSFANLATSFRSRRGWSWRSQTPVTSRDKLSTSIPKYPAHNDKYAGAWHAADAPSAMGKSRLTSASPHPLHHMYSSDLFFPPSGIGMADSLGSHSRLSRISQGSRLRMGMHGQPHPGLQNVGTVFDSDLKPDGHLDPKRPLSNDRSVLHPIPSKHEGFVEMAGTGYRSWGQPQLKHVGFDSGLLVSNPEAAGPEAPGADDGSYHNSAAYAKLGKMYLSNRGEPVVSHQSRGMSLVAS